MRRRELAVGIAIIALAFLQINAVIKQPGAAENREALSQETAALFAWIRQNTPTDSIFLAPPYEAHRIMAFADRRVIASGKVYPSETKELAERLRDLSTFFFTTDDGEAERIVDNYQAQYVFLPRNPRFLDFCEAGGGCFLATYRDRKGLTPDGNTRSVIGRLLASAEVPGMRPVWDSPNFLVYRIVSRTSAPACELDGTEKMAATRFVRTMLDTPQGQSPQPPADFENMPCAIHLSLWSNGGILGETVASGDTFAENLENGAERLIVNLVGDMRPAMRDAWILLAVWDKTQFVFEAPERLGRPIESGRGYVFQTGNDPVFLFPFAYPVETRAENTVAAAFLRFCRQSDTGAQCDETNIKRFGSFPVHAWIEQLSRRMVEDLSGTVPLDPVLATFNAGTLHIRIRAALEAFMDEYRSGDLEAHYTPEQLFLIARAFIAGSRTFGEPAYFTAATRIASRGREIPPASPESSALTDTSYGLMAYLDLWRASGNTQYLDVARSFAKTLTRAPSPNSLSLNPRADAAAFLALAEYVRGTDDQETAEWLRARMALFRDLFFERRIEAAHVFFSAKPTVAEAALLMRGFALAGDPEFADALGTWLLESADADSSSDTGEIALALSAATGEPARSPEFKHALEDTLLRLMRLQYTADSAYFIAPSQIKNYLGTIRTNAQVMRFSTTGTANFILAGAKYLEMSGIQR